MGVRHEEGMWLELSGGIAWRILQLSLPLYPTFPFAKQISPFWKPYQLGMNGAGEARERELLKERAQLYQQPVKGSVGG